MKSLIFFPLIALLLLSSNSQAQSSIYFLYDANCVQKLEYARLGVFPDVEFTDYVFSPTPNKKIILRVKKIAINKSLVASIPNSPFMCNNQSKITNAVINNINKFKSVAYIVVPLGNQYEMYEVNSIATLEESDQKTTYKARDLSFSFEHNLAHTTTNLNLDATAENQIYFVNKSKLNCLDNYSFKIINKKSSASDYSFNWLNGVGFQRIYTTKGEMRLSSINNQKFDDFLLKNCGALSDLTTPVTAAIPSNKTNKLSPTDSIIAASKKKTPTTNNPIVNNNPYSNPYNNPYSNPIPNTTPRGSANIPSTNPAPPTTQPLNQVDGNGNYIVKEKECLYTISERFGLSINRLMELNNKKDYDLVTGQKLKVVDDASVPHLPHNPVIETDLTTRKQTIFHIVQQGDNLFKISQKYGITLTQLYNLNTSTLKNEDINIDQKLIVGYKQL